MGDHFIDAHHVGVFVMQIEQVYLVRKNAAVEAAFLDDDDVKAVGVGVDSGGSHAARSAFAADDQRPDAELA